MIQRGIDSGHIKHLPLYTITNAIGTACSLIFCISPLVPKVYDVDVMDRARFEEIADAVVEIIFHGILTRRE